MRTRTHSGCRACRRCAPWLLGGRCRTHGRRDGGRLVGGAAAVGDGGHDADGAGHGAEHLVQAESAGGLQREEEIQVRATCCAEFGYGREDGADHRRRPCWQPSAVQPCRQGGCRGRRHPHPRAGTATSPRQTANAVGHPRISVTPPPPPHTTHGSRDGNDGGLQGGHSKLRKLRCVGRTARPTKSSFWGGHWRK